MMPIYTLLNISNHYADDDARSMTPSRNTRRYTLRSVPSSPGRSFFPLCLDIVVLKQLRPDIMLPMGGMYIFGAILYAARSVLHNTYSFSLNLFFYSKFRFFCFTFLLNFNFYFSLLDGASLFYLYLFVNFYFSILTFLLTFNVTFLFQIFTFLWGQVSVLQCSATFFYFHFSLLLPHSENHLPAQVSRMSLPWQL